MSEEETVTTAESVDAQEAPETTEEVAPNEETAEADAESETADETEESEEKPEVSAEERQKIAQEAYRQRENRRLKQQNARLEQMLEKALTQHNNQSSKQAPKLEDFDTIDEYLDAKLEYHDSAKGAKQQPVESHSELEVYKDELYAVGESKYSDFAEKVGSDDILITNEMAAAIFEIDDVALQADVSYYLGNNTAETNKIARLSPVKQIAAIAKIEDKLSKPASSTKQASKAPKPIKPVGGTKTTTDEILPEEAFTSFLKKRNKQLGRG